MPLEHGAHGSKDTYLKRVRIPVNSELRESTSNSQFDFVFELPSTYEHVASIELVDYNVSHSHQRTFRDIAPANNTVTVHLASTAGAPQSLTFKVTFTPYTRDTAPTITELATQLTSEFNEAMDAQTHAYFNSTDTPWVITEKVTTNVMGVCNALDFYIFDITNTLPVAATFLFGSVPTDSAAMVLGFTDSDTSVFTVDGTTYYYPIPSFIPTLVVDRYMDIFIDQFPELRPLARIFLTDDTNYTSSLMAIKDVRLLTTPVPRLEKLTIRLRLPNNRIPMSYIAKGVDLVFELLLVSSENELPLWVDQQLAM